jgi:hypothetical protein
MDFDNRLALEHTIAAGQLPGPHRDAWNRVAVARACGTASRVLMLDPVFATMAYRPIGERSSPGALGSGAWYPCAIMPKSGTRFRRAARPRQRSWMAEADTWARRPGAPSGFDAGQSARRIGRGAERGGAVQQIEGTP